MNFSGPKEKLMYRLKVGYYGSFIILSWGVSIYLLAKSNIRESDVVDVSAILFGASTIALVVLSIIVAALGFVGWQSIQGVIRDKVAAVTDEKTIALENELRGRVFSTQGYVIGEAAKRAGSLEVYDRDKMEEAIELCRKGYGFLKRVGGPGEYMCLNNLVHFMFLLGNDADQGFLLKQARCLREVGESRDSVDLILTAAGVILKYSYISREKAEIRSILAGISNSANIPYAKKKEASMYLASFPE